MEKEIILSTVGYDLIDSPGGWSVTELNGDNAGKQGIERLLGRNLDEQRERRQWKWMQLAQGDVGRRICNLLPRDVIAQYKEQRRRDREQNLAHLKATKLPGAYSMRTLCAAMDTFGITGQSKFFDEAITWARDYAPKTLRKVGKLETTQALQHDLRTQFDEQHPELDEHDRRETHQYLDNGRLLAMAFNVLAYQRLEHPELGLILEGECVSTRKPATLSELWDWFSMQVHYQLHGQQSRMPESMAWHLQSFAAAPKPAAVYVGDENWEKTLFLHPGHVCTEKPLLSPMQIQLQTSHEAFSTMIDDKIAQKNLIAPEFQTPWMEWDGSRKSVLAFLKQADRLAAASGLPDLENFPLVVVKGRFGSHGEQVDILHIDDVSGILQALSKYKAHEALLELFVPSAGDRQRVMRLLEDYAFDSDRNSVLLFRTAYWRESPLIHDEARNDLNRGLRINYSSSEVPAIPRHAGKTAMRGATEVAESVRDAIAQFYAEGPNQVEQLLACA